MGESPFSQAVLRLGWCPEGETGIAPADRTEASHDVHFRRHARPRADRTSHYRHAAADDRSAADAGNRASDVALDRLGQRVRLGVGTGTEPARLAGGDRLVGAASRAAGRLVDPARDDASRLVDPARRE